MSLEGIVFIQFTIIYFWMNMARLKAKNNATWFSFSIPNGKSFAINSES